MSDMSIYLGNKIVRWLAGNAMPSAPTNCYLALFDGDPKSGGSEVTTDVRSAGRVAIDFESAPAAGTDNDITTDADSDFGASEGDADITHVAVYDAASSGNLLFAKALGSPVSVETGEEVKFEAGDITFTIGD